MIFFKKVKLKKINKNFINSFYNKKNRYEIITDLVEKNKIKEFLNFCNFNFKSLGYDEKIEIYLNVVFFKKNKINLPVFNFLSFDVLNKNKVINSCKGIMFSTYIHDLDRSMLESNCFKMNHLSLCIWNKLFENLKKGSGLQNGG